jgi:hypothetical protein
MGRPWYEYLIYPEWMRQNEDYDDIRRQEAKTSSLEYRMDRLERQILDMQKHILGLEALLAQHGIVPPMTEEEAAAAAKAKPVGEPATFPTRTEENIVCPHCGRRQKGNRNACYSCGTPFHYKDE